MEEKVTVVINQFTSYSLLYSVTINSSTTSETISCTFDFWDNLYGNGNIAISSASYPYKIGTDIRFSSTNKITTYLIETVAHAARVGATTVTSTYPINVTLSIDIAMNISEQQEVTTLTLTWVRYNQKKYNYKLKGGYLPTYKPGENGQLLVYNWTNNVLCIITCFLKYCGMESGKQRRRPWLYKGVWAWRFWAELFLFVNFYDIIICQYFNYDGKRILLRGALFCLYGLSS